MKIPEQFRDCHFLKVAVMGKSPVTGETNWKRTAAEIEKHTGNVGLHLDSNMIVVDLDDMPSAEEFGILEMLPPTYVVKTGSGGQHHFYYCDEPERRAYNHPTKLKPDGKPVHVLDIKALEGAYVVFQGSIHPNKNLYTCLHDRAIATLDLQAFIATVEEKLNIAKPEKRRPWKEVRITRELEFDISDVWAIDRRKRVEYGYAMAHPTHGSGTGHNCVVDYNYKWFRCFRCEATGNAVKALALSEGIIHNCDDDIDNDKYIEVMKAAERRSLIKKTIRRIASDTVTPRKKKGTV